MLGTGSRVSLHQSWSKLYIANFLGRFFLFGVAGAEGVAVGDLSGFVTAEGNRGEDVHLIVDVVSVTEALRGELNMSGLPGIISEV